jgi:Cysteine rich repeat
MRTNIQFRAHVIPRTQTFLITSWATLQHKATKMRSIALTVLVALGFLSSAALAQEGTHRGACRADAQKLCAGVEHGGGRILDCLANQKDKLSDDCRKMVESRGR